MGRKQACPNIGFERQLQLLEECGNDLDAAQQRWSEQSGRDVMDEARAARQAANELHIGVDLLEEQIAEARSQASNGTDNVTSQRDKCVLRLDDLQRKIDTSLGTAH